MKLPRISGTIDRRLLINFTVEPDVAREFVPQPFQPKIIRGSALAGICLIRLTHVRPVGFPKSVGVSSENVAHRIAVTWNDGGRKRSGVFIPRRDTSSRVNSLLGGRLFPGVQHHASFAVEERPPDYRVSFESDDQSVRVSVCGRLSAGLPDGSVFSSLQDASAFFESGAVGYSVTRDAGRFDGLELDTASWQIEPLDVSDVRSSFFDSLPSGTARFDSALIMRGIEHEWRAMDPICAA